MLPVADAVVDRAVAEHVEIGGVGSGAEDGDRARWRRTAALSSWLAAGVPPTEVAARAGNSVKVLLTVYAKCLADQQSIYNERISGLLES